MKLKIDLSVRFVLVRYMIFIVLGGAVGKIFPPQEEIFFIYLCIMGISSVFINIPVPFNERIYGFIAAFMFGFWISLLFPQSMDPIKFFWLFGGLFLLVLSIFVLFLAGRWLDYDIGKQPLKSWNERNYFPQRARDLERIIDCLRRKETTSIGVEAEWGDGKSFLMEGLRERLSHEGHTLITIDVMAIRLDNFPEYLIHELDATLFRQGRLSFHSRALKHILKASKLDALFLLWGNMETRYAKLFDAFREELLTLNQQIILVYEDIDRIDDVKGIKNILYLSEKLTEQQSRWTNSSIKVIYQYNATHMRMLGFDRVYLEKYIQNRISLTRISLLNLIQVIQASGFSNKKILSQDDVFRLPPYLYVGRRAFLRKEQEWMERHFLDRFTIRRAKSFLQAVIFRFENLPFELSETERSLVVAFSFIEYFMPNVYDRINIHPLYRGFDIFDEHGRRYTMVDVQNEKIEDLLNPEHYPVNFELYIAWRLLGLDVISAFQRIDYSEVSE